MSNPIRNINFILLWMAIKRDGLSGHGTNGGNGLSLSSVVESDENSYLTGPSVLGLDVGLPMLAEFVFREVANASHLERILEVVVVLVVANCDHVWWGSVVLFGNQENDWDLLVQTALQRRCLHIFLQQEAECLPSVLIRLLAELPLGSFDEFVRTGEVIFIKIRRVNKKLFAIGCCIGWKLVVVEDCLETAMPR
jgi:hypothetical protein